MSQTKVTLSGSTLSSHICSKCAIASLACPCMANPTSNAIEETTCSHILHTCQQGDSQQIYLNHTCFEWSASARLASSSATVLAHAFSDSVWLHTFLLHLLEYLQCLVPFPTVCISQYHGSSQEHIMQEHLPEHSPCILHAPTFGIHICKAILHKDIWLATTSMTELFMKTPARTWSTWKASLLTFSNLWSHHCEGSENKSCQSCTLWPPGTMQTAEISDKICHQTADLIHAHANDRTPVFCDPDSSFTIWCKHISFCNCRNCLVPFKQH